MTREEEIDMAVVAYSNETEFDGCDYIGGAAKETAFIAGAKWADQNPNGSLIKWQTGEPKENGFYAVTYQFPNNCRANVTALAYTGKTWINGDWQEIDKSRIIAWCKLSNIEPYKGKEET